MTSDIGSEQFLNLFLNDTPMMDVRAPNEFDAGAFPNALNLPLLDNEQRHIIGLEYKKSGQQAAIDLGLQMATPAIREQRLMAWQSYTNTHPQGVLYCFRGGLRSQTTQAWLRDAGCHYPLVNGGYKAMRRFLLDQLERLCADGNILVLSGATGVGKTDLINSIPNSIDLEGRANHRGSAFGQNFSAQPSQINWENQIIIDWLKREAAGNLPLVVEDESKLIGRIGLPECLRQAMQQAPRVLLQASIEERVTRLQSDYVLQALQHFQHTEADPWLALQQNIQHNLSRINKRLGGAQFQKLTKLLPGAITALRDHEDAAGIQQFIETLLHEYYDNFYTYQMEKNQHLVIRQGDFSQLILWFKENEKRLPETAASVLA